MFEDKMRQIEEDIVPFGIIDDGSQYIDQIDAEEEARKYGGWHDFSTIDDRWD
jgi:hypothetical protein